MKRLFNKLIGVMLCVAMLSSLFVIAPVSAKVVDEKPVVYYEFYTENATNFTPYENLKTGEMYGKKNVIYVGTDNTAYDKKYIGVTGPDIWPEYYMNYDKAYLEFDYLTTSTDTASLPTQVELHFSNTGGGWPAQKLSFPADQIEKNEDGTVKTGTWNTVRMPVYLNNSANVDKWYQVRLSTSAVPTDIYLTNIKLTCDDPEKQFTPIFRKDGSPNTALYQVGYNWVQLGEVSDLSYNGYVGRKASGSSGEMNLWLGGYDGTTTTALGALPHVSASDKLCFWYRFDNESITTDAQLNAYITTAAKQEDGTIVSTGKRYRYEMKAVAVQGQAKYYEVPLSGMYWWDSANSKDNVFTGDAYVCAIGFTNPTTTSSSTHYVGQLGFSHADASVSVTSSVNDKAVTLNWSSTHAETDKYDIYRDGTKIASDITATTYNDNLNSYGKHTYDVVAKTDNDEYLNEGSASVRVYAPGTIFADDFNDYTEIAKQSDKAGAAYDNDIFQYNLWTNITSVPSGFEKFGTTIGAAENIAKFEEGTGVGDGKALVITGQPFHGVYRTAKASNITTDNVGNKQLVFTAKFKAPGQLIYGEGFGMWIMDDNDGYLYDISNNSGIASGTNFVKNELLYVGARDENNDRWTAKIYAFGEEIATVNKDTVYDYKLMLTPQTDGNYIASVTINGVSKVLSGVNMPKQTELATYKRLYISPVFAQYSINDKGYYNDLPNGIAADTYSMKDENGYYKIGRTIGIIDNINMMAYTAGTENIPVDYIFVTNSTKDDAVVTNTCTVGDVLNINAGNSGQLIIATYNADNTLADVKLCDALTATHTAGSEEKIKVFFWESITSLAPLTEAKNIAVQAAAQ